MLDGFMQTKETSGCSRLARCASPLLPARRADILVVSRKFERPAIEAGDAHTPSPSFMRRRDCLGFRRVWIRPGPEIPLVKSAPGLSLAFCGIGNPGAFFDDLSRWHVPIAEKKSFFRSPQIFRRGEVEQPPSCVPKLAALWALVTTEKGRRESALY